MENFDFDRETLGAGGREIVKYDFEGYPAMIRKNDILDGNSYASPLHFHDDFELLSVASGSLLQFVEGERFELGAGEGIFINARRLHQIRFEKGKNCVLYSIVFHPSLFTPVQALSGRFMVPFLSYGPSCMYLSGNSAWQQGILDAIRSIYEHAGEENGLLQVQTLLSGIFGELYRHTELQAQEGAAVSENPESFLPMLFFLRKNLTRELSLKEIAEKGGFCETTCISLFKKYTGETPMKFLCQERLQRGIDLLTGTDLTITEIAYRSGFSGASYFTESFRKVYGITPSTYRKQMKIQREEASQERVFR